MKGAEFFIMTPLQSPDLPPSLSREPVEAQLQLSVVTITNLRTVMLILYVMVSFHPGGQRRERILLAILDFSRPQVRLPNAPVSPSTSQVHKNPRAAQCLPQN